MPDVRECQTVIESAEKAAGAGDFAGAEALLRDAAALQEAALGPLHPDLASTFNNLAVACEMTHKPADAEQFYRRAYALAAAGLDPEHPLVATSRDNLRDFCQARGLPLEDWAGVGAARAPAAPSNEPSLRPNAAVQATLAPRLVAAGASMGGFGVAAAGLAVLATLVVGRLWLAAPVVNRAPGEEAQIGRTRPEGVAAATDPAPQAASPEPASPAPATPAPGVTRPVAATASAATVAGGGPRVLTAAVCRTLTTDGAWQCDPAGGVSAPGRLSYYTRIASDTGTRVRHRWYLDDRLRHEATLTVSANPNAGYRTFSRLTVSAGSWRVELRDEGGAVLDQTRFEVR